MGKIDDYRATLRALDGWDDYLLAESRLPGPRANLELAYAVGFEGSEQEFLRWASIDSERAPKGSTEEFLTVCGVVGLGYLAARGGARHFDRLRRATSDVRWRVREAVALGLQRFGEADFEALMALMHEWLTGPPLERRAVVATLCEPSLLRLPGQAGAIIDALDRITDAISSAPDRRSDDFRALRKSLGYGWSVAVAAQPAMGMPRMERWILSSDKDIRWIMNNNLKKKRLSKIDPAWVETQRETLGGR